MPYPLNRRQFLTGLGAGGIAGLGSLALPGTAAGQSSLPGSSSRFFGGLLPDRPSITHGVASGDVTTSSALVWTRADRPSRMIVETCSDASFRNVRRYTSEAALTPESGFTGKLRLAGLNPGEVHYRVQAEDLYSGALSEPTYGFLRIPGERRNIRFHWSADVAGQGYGINPEMGGMIGWRTMAERNPDFFLHSGDTIYADNPIKEEVTLPDGKIWKNVVTEEVSRVAQSLEDYRGRYAYNLLDENYRDFNARVPQIVQWDDHETVNNWYPNEVLDLDEYRVKDVNTLADWSHQAFHEWQPTDPTLPVDGRIYRKLSHGPLLDIFVLDMRSYKDDNTLNHKGTQADGRILGAAQEQWLIQSLQQSTATWKIVANDLPLGIVVPDGDHQEGVSNGSDGVPVGREAEIARVLQAIREVPNVVWLTADVHYCAAHHYDPSRAQFQDFAPFWEFVAGPLNAGAFGPNKMDGTFGPEVVFSHAGATNESPLGDSQHFGEVDIDAESRELTVRLITTRGAVLFEKSLSAS
ncbi:alkaline phosphatase D family protein [Corynebacterium tapiri]|uniref:Twin-arginine translocation signal domain-containing protein n=1 Tax=Corynebacterium tapiri TaxID=1448266 RepID=A0A5C4U5T5_9CORY|nr:alkaline phosphatase D family protein [Corynebacterium tapiri]TNL97733.1 twin-arginine translocation signal domain-containing protein [Corynebacterium tapiri]